MPDTARSCVGGSFEKGRQEVHVKSCQNICHYTSPLQVTPRTNALDLEAEGERKRDV